MLARTYRSVPSVFGRDVDSLFENFFQGYPQAGVSGGGIEHRFPALNIWENEAGFHLEADLPGMKLEELEITVLGNELTLKGERTAAPQEGAAYHVRERSAGAFSRLVRFPVDLDAEKAQARLENGVLTLDLPRHASALPRKIEVKALNGK
ncbi:MAG: Hsp20/alpha crystallin family protein [Planctomycetes bacterium]|nr:Hsp20/alpha crystallin family protein [Planctomycetota bacterium]